MMKARKLARLTKREREVLRHSWQDLADTLVFQGHDARCLCAACLASVVLYDVVRGGSGVRYFAPGLATAGVRRG